MKQYKSIYIFGILIVLGLGGGFLYQSSPLFQLHGIWLFNENHTIWNINIFQQRVEIYQLTTMSCVRDTFMESIANQNNNEDDDAESGSMTVVGDQLVFQDGQLTRTATRLDTLPSRCQATQNADDPEVNFEVFWHNFNENYAFFDLRAINWDAQYEHYRPQVTAETSDAELFAILSDMVQPTQDGHVFLVRPNLTEPEAFYRPVQDSNWMQEQDVFLNLIQEEYLQEGWQTVANQKIIYGKLTDSVGYLNILAMTGFINDDAPWLQDPTQENRVLNQELEQIVHYFEEVDSLIIDVRFNGGGSDENALSIASWFADQRRLILTKQTRMIDGFTAPQELYLTPHSAMQFTKPIILLTSSETFSGGEIFTMSMRVLPHVTVIGENTGGGLSNMLFRQLPNGWIFGLSNEVYKTPDNEIYEGVGLPPNVLVPIELSDIEQGRDEILERALQVSQGDS